MKLTPKFSWLKSATRRALKRRERVTCRIEWGALEWDDPDHYWCTNCGAPLPDGINEEWFAYIEGRCERPVDCCPRCGAKVVDE